MEIVVKIAQQRACYRRRAECFALISSAICTESKNKKSKVLLS